MLEKNTGRFGLVLAALGLAAVGLGWQRDQRVQDALYEHLTYAEHQAMAGGWEAAEAHTALVLLNRPVRILLPDGAPNSTARRALEDAISAWETALEGGVRFEIVTEGEAEILLRWSPTWAFNGRPAAGYANWRRWVETGDSGFTYRLHVEITLALGWRHGWFDSATLRHAALHELGHVLGLADSAVAGDAMSRVDPTRPVQVPSPDEVAALRSLRYEAGSILQRAIVALHGH